MIGARAIGQAIAGRIAVRKHLFVADVRESNAKAAYAPWRNLAIFIQDFGYSSGLVLLGKLDGDMEALKVPGPIHLAIEIIK